MFGMDTTDLVVLAVAAFLAVTSLVRLMNLHREGVLNELKRDAEEEKRRQITEKKKAEKERAAQAKRDGNKVA